MPEHRSDPDLLRRCAAGDPRAWDELVDRYGRLVYSIPLRYGCCDADAADVMQNVFTQAFRKLDQLKDERRLSAWLITIAHRESWRVGKRGDTPGLDDRIADVGSPDEDDAIRWEHQQLVRQGIEQLDQKCRDLLTALFLDRGNPTYEMVAQRLGVKVGSLGPNRARCFKKLEAILRKDGDFEVR